MIKIRIREAAEAKDLKNAHRLQLAADLSPAVAARLWRGEVEKISIETLNRLCVALDCQPGDLFVYEPDLRAKRQREMSAARLRADG